MKFKVYFKHSDGTPDEIVISGDTIEEIKEKKNREMIARNATYIGSEKLSDSIED